ncbi:MULTISPECIES: response regulator [Ralstonia]|uniref:response regulator n=1 Tax=Ralstonia TaxID=48736 RepID=UPI000C7ABDA8|nr:MULTISPECIES: response regulator [Ralstonia]PLT16459.1 hypothetical protein CXP34_20195 [Ralstonia mannitolilytica]
MKVFFVDENEEQRETYRLLLQQCLASDKTGVVVEGVEPKRELAEMQFLVTSQDVVAVVLDEKLKDSGVARYFGIELAQYLRAINKKIPIYILTSFVESEEIADGEFSVEDVLDKQKLADRYLIEGARILRRINIYKDILGDREERFEVLLRKSVEKSIGEDELEEFKELGYLRAQGGGSDEIVYEKDLDKLREMEEKLRLIEDKIEALK